MHFVLKFIRMKKMKHTKSRFNRALCRGIGLLLVGATSSHADGNLSAEQEMFTGHRYAAGLVHLRKAAETGDRDARRTPGLMLFYGEALYDVEVPTHREDGLRWRRLAAADGCETSMHVLAKLGKTSRCKGDGMGVNSNHADRWIH